MHSRFTVGRRDVRRFAEAVSADHGVHHDPVTAREYGYADLVAPPTFATVFVMDSENALLSREFPDFDPSGGIHVSASFRQETPLLAGHTYAIASTIESVAPRGARSLVDIDTVVLGPVADDRDGADVVLVWSSVLLLHLPDGHALSGTSHRR